MKLFKLAPIVAALAITAAPVAAEEVNGLTYNRAGIGYGSASINTASGGVSIDGDASGVGIELQAVVAENFVLGFGYTKVDGDLTGRVSGRSVKLDFENTIMSLTFGYRFGVAQGTDVVPFLQYTNSDSKLNGQSVDDNTTTYGLRLNTRLSETAQATIGFRTDGKDDEFGKAFDVGLLFKVQPTVGLGLGYSLNDSDSGDVKTWTATVEYLF
jgi:hypothetical protein